MAEETRHNERIEKNPLTGEVEYHAWTDDEGILHEEYPEPELTEEQRARLDRFMGDMFENEEDWLARRAAQKAARKVTGQGRQRKAHKAEPPTE